MLGGRYVGGYVGGMGVRWGGAIHLGGRLGGYIRWGGVRWGDGGTLGGGGFIRWGGYVGEGVCWGGGGGVEELVTMLFWALFGKLLHIGRPWMNLIVRVLQKVAKIRVIILINFHGFYVQKIIPYIENKNGL